MKKLFLVATALVCLATSAHAEMKYPNWWNYRLANVERLEKTTDRDVWVRRYFECNYTTRTCLNGWGLHSRKYDYRGIQVGWEIHSVFGEVVDGDNHKNVLRHVNCAWRGKWWACEDYDNGIDMEGKDVTVPDMPSSCVEAMRTNGVKCKNYSWSFGVLEDENGRTVLTKEERVQQCAFLRSNHANADSIREMCEGK